MIVFIQENILAEEFSTFVSFESSACFLRGGFYHFTLL